ncbi:MAG: hypothetical protein ABSG49_10115 [Methanoregula sp.]|jgi:hypothetical protein
MRDSRLCVAAGGVRFFTTAGTAGKSSSLQYKTTELIRFRE